ncbi:MAG TPA: hypothetical protein PKW10_12750, partial [Saprospiraceae bacterium]|nr:hypothetical protein [Saprospiraceae bacterium]
MLDLNVDNLLNKVHNYNAVFENTQKYRNVWRDSLKNQIISDVTEICKAVGLKIEIEATNQFSNLEA